MDNHSTYTIWMLSSKSFALNKNQSCNDEEVFSPFRFYFNLFLLLWDFFSVQIDVWKDFFTWFSMTVKYWMKKYDHKSLSLALCWTCGDNFLLMFIGCCHIISKSLVSDTKSPSPYKVMTLLLYQIHFLVKTGQISRSSVTT